MAFPLILVHGGAGAIPDSRVKGKLDGVRRAIKLAYEKYDQTKNILDATQAAVEYMETDENFNAGLLYFLHFPSKFANSTLKITFSNLSIFMENFQHCS